jgi:Mn-dependent DtxR family transcriptional regulator
LRRQLEDENLLASLYDLAEQSPEGVDTVVTVPMLATRRSWSPKSLQQSLDRAVRRSWVDPRGDCYSPTHAGLTEAARAARGHRLWRLFLVEHPELATGVVDLDLSALDDSLERDMIDELERKLEAEHRLPSIDRLLAAGSSAGRNLP